MGKNPMQVTLEQYMPEIFQTQSVGVGEVHAQVSHLQDNVKVWMESQDLSEKCSGCSKKKTPVIDPNGAFTRTCEECFRRIMDGTLPMCKLKWGSVGTMSNGRYSTQKTSISHKIGNEYTQSDTGRTLSDVLEQTVDPKYFLSQTAIDRLVSYKDTKVENLIPPTERERERRMQYANTIDGKSIVRESRGVYPTTDGKLIRVNGYHRK